MPIYGYRCSECGHELEVFQSMSAEPLRVCTDCSGALRKLLYPVGVHFKGSGFYTTDYRNGGGSDGKPAAGGSGESGSSSSSSPDSGSGKSGAGAGSSSEKKAESPAAKE
jgi:putative FmdB family regulatory protein